MQKVRAKTIKGLSIASIILSALYLIAFLIGAAALCALTAYYEPLVDSMGSHSSLGYGNGYEYGLHSYSPAFDSPYYSYGYDYYDDTLDASYLLPILQIGFVCIIIGIIMQAISLVSAIIILLNCSKPQKLGMCFAWGIVGAILSFISGGIAQTVLFVLAAIFSYSDQKLYKSGMYPGAYGTPGVQVTVPAQNVAQPMPTTNIQAVPTQAPVQVNQNVPGASQQSAPATPQAQPPAQVDASPAQAPSNGAAPAVDAQSEETIQVADEILDPVKEETTVIEGEISTGENADGQQ